MCTTYSAFCVFPRRIGKYRICTCAYYYNYCASDSHYRQCVGMVVKEDGVYEALLPSGHVISSVLQYVWALWEDPIDVSTYPSSSPFYLPDSLSLVHAL